MECKKIDWNKDLFFGFSPKITAEQKTYVDSIFNNLLTIVNAKSGTGKTTLAVASAKLLGKPLLYIFNPVEEGKLGFRPGTQEEKEDDYLQPLRDALLEINENPSVVIKRENVSDKAGKTWVEAKSHIFARGTNIKDKTVIIDEAQNWTKDQLKKILTRIHDSCKVIVIGHTGQIDLDKHNDSGFQFVINHFKDKSYVNVCTLTVNFRGVLATDADEM